MRLPRKARRSGLAFAALVAALLVSAAPAAADMVTTLDNAGAGSLRSAIASTAAGATVTFAPGLDGTILLSEDLVIDKDLTIDGPSAQDLVISGNDATRVFQIYGLGTEVTIDDVTIRDGRADGDEPIGAGVWFIQGQALTLERVAVVSNESIKTDAVTPLGGGITVFDGHLEVIDSTLEDNRATDGTGGGLFIGTPATFEVSNSTIADNVASLGGGGLVSANAAGTITSSTIARNESSAQPGGGIRASGPAVVTLARSLVSGNSAGTAPDCLGPVASAGRNVLTSIAGCGIAPVASDATGVVAGLGPLGHHGGPTRTLLPLAGNPAIDHIPGPCPGADQRGVARPQGASCDAGAVELRSAQLTALGPLALGSAQVGQQSAPVSVEITNAGDLDADITAVTLTGPNAAEVAPVADPDACTDATVLGPGATCTLKARLSPTSVGAKQATYSVALAGSSVDVAVTGAGDPAPQPPADQGESSNPPPTLTPSADATLLGTSTKAGKGGKLKLRVRCTTVSAARCLGSVKLKVGARKLTKAFSIVAGKEAVVTLKLGAGDRRKLTRRRSLKSAVTVVTRQPDGTSRTRQGPFRLRA